jgi:hypothetical protein
MADVETIDAAHSRLQAQADQTLATIRTLSTKLQGAAAGGDTLAREWNLDLREIALAIQAEQQQVGALVQALHDFVVNNAHQPVAAAPYQQQAYQQPQYQQPQYQQPQYQQPAYQPQYQQPMPQSYTPPPPPPPQRQTVIYEYAAPPQQIVYVTPPMPMFVSAPVIYGYVATPAAVAVPSGYVYGPYGPMATAVYRPRYYAPY